MSGLLSTLNTAKSGMNVSQVAIQTTSHNISNINRTDNKYLKNYLLYLEILNIPLY